MEATTPRRDTTSPTPSSRASRSSLESGRPGEARQIVLDTDGDRVTFDEDDIGPDWEADPDAGGDVLPVAWLEHGAVAFRANDARARFAGGVPEERDRASRR